jgi:hypothetical protein
MGKHFLYLFILLSYSFLSHFSHSVELSLISKYESQLVDLQSKLEKQTTEAATEVAAVKDELHTQLLVCFEPTVPRRRRLSILLYFFVLFYFIFFFFD